MTRYWMDQVAKFGGSQDMAEHLFNNRDNQLRWASTRLAHDTIDSSFDHPVPWANAGEGMMPDLTNDDVQYDDWWQEKFEDLNTEAAGQQSTVDAMTGEPDTGGWEVDEDDLAKWIEDGSAPDEELPEPDKKPTDVPTIPTDGRDETPDADSVFHDHWATHDNDDGVFDWNDPFYNVDPKDDPAPAADVATTAQGTMSSVPTIPMQDYVEMTPAVEASIYHYEHPAVKVV